MPTPRINGRLGPVRQKIRISYDPTRGQQIEIPYESAGNHLIGAALQFQNLRIAYDLEPNGHKSRLVARASGPQIGIPDLTCDDWQILANEIQKDIFEHPDFANIPQDEIQEIRRGIADNLKSFELSITPANGSEDLFDLLSRGTTHYNTSQHVIRHTTNVSNAFAINVSDVNVERIYTTAQLVGAGGELVNAANWTFPMPGRMAFKITNLPAPPARAKYRWGWRKLPSTETTASGNRINITTEYWLEQWSTVLYGVVA